MAGKTNSSRGRTRKKTSVSDDIPSTDQCDKCKKIVQDEGVACHMCSQWTHYTCADIGDVARAKELIEKDNILWFCDSCSETVPTILQEYTKIQVLQVEQKKALDDTRRHFHGQKVIVEENDKRLKEMEKIIQENDLEDTKKRLQDLENFIENLKSGTSHIPQHMNPGASPTDQNEQIKFNGSVDDVTRQVRERLDRQSNIIIFNLPESNSNIKTEVNQHDQNLIVELNRYLCQQDFAFTAQRLGARKQKPPADEVQDNGEVEGDDDDDDDDRTVIDQKVKERFISRPIKVTFEDVNSKIKVMKSLYKLAHDEVPDSLASISVKHDLTPAERILEKKFKDNIKGKNDELEKKGLSKNCKYVLTGAPGARSVKLLRRQGGRWVPSRDQNDPLA